MTIWALYFENHKAFVYYHFEEDIKLFVPIILETFVSIILKKKYIIFIYKYWHFNLCLHYFKEDKNSLYS